MYFTTFNHRWPGDQLEDGSLQQQRSTNALPGARRVLPWLRHLTRRAGWVVPTANVVGRQVWGICRFAAYIRDPENPLFSSVIFATPSTARNLVSYHVENAYGMCVAGCRGNGECTQQVRCGVIKVDGWTHTK